MLLKPHVTEKTLKEAANSRYTFIVGKTSDKGQIARVISSLYKVTVKRVQTTLIPTKRRRIGVTAKRTDSAPQKKATVILVKGQKIDLYEVSKDEPKKEEVKKEGK